MQQVLHFAHTVDLACLDGEPLPLARVLELAAEEDHAILDADADRSLGGVGVAEDLALDLAAPARIVQSRLRGDPAAPRE
jgi:hypothetical protein